MKLSDHFINNTYWGFEGITYAFIRDRLSIYGSVLLFGSARANLAFSNGHDFDVGLITEYKSKDLLENRCRQLIDDWFKMGETLPLHIYVIGKFNPDFIVVKKGNGDNFIQFQQKHQRYILWFLINLKKLKELMFKKFLRIKNKYLSTT